MGPERFFLCDVGSVASEEAPDSEEGRGAVESDEEAVEGAALGGPPAVIRDVAPPLVDMPVVELVLARLLNCWEVCDWRSFVVVLISNKLIARRRARRHTYRQNNQREQGKKRLFPSY